MTAAHPTHGTPPEVHAGIATLVQRYESLSLASLDDLLTCYTPNARFKDPFNDVHGVASIRQVFAHMFATVDAPQFMVKEQMVQGHNACLVWEFHFRMRRWRKGVEQCIRGSSWLSLDAQGRVLAHRDYWDAAEELYEKLPLLGGFMRLLRHAGAAPSV